MYTIELWFLWIIRCNCQYLYITKIIFIFVDYYYANEIKRNAGKLGRFRRRFQNHGSNTTHRKYRKRNYSTKGYILDNDIDNKGNIARLIILF